MGRLRDEVSCENCGRHDRGMSPTLDAWLRCPYCRRQRAGVPPGRRLQRLFRIRPRRGDDGTTVFERSE